MYLYELGTRPWEANTEEERKRIQEYEAFCKMTVAQNLMIDVAKTLAK